MLDNFRKRMAVALLPSGVKNALTPFQVLSMQNAGIPIYTDMSVRKATREGYKISVYVYRSVRTIVQAVSGIPWVVLDKDGQPIENHEFTKVWAKPNKEFSGQDNMEFIIAHQLLCGNALIQPIIVNGRPREFWIVMPDLVHPIPSDQAGEWLKGWEVTSIDGSQRIVPPDQFVHFMQQNPADPYWGIGPLMAAARTVDTDNEAQDTQKISMQNRGTPDGIFEADGLTEEQYDEATRRIEERYLTKESRRKPWVVAGAKWHQMSLTAVEMDYIASRLANLRGIAAAFGLDPWWLGDRSASTYNNVLEARKALYTEVALPMLDDIKATLNLKIAPLYGQDITISYDISKIVALREDFTKKVEQAKTLWAMGVPFNQISQRLEMGFEEFAGWDQGYLPFNLSPTTGAKSDFVETDPWFKEMRERAGSFKVLDLQTEEAKTAHWKRIDRRRAAWWGVVSKKVKPLYDDEALAVGKAIKGKKPDKLIDAASEAIDSLSPEWEKMLVAISTVLIEDFGNEIAEDLGGQPKSDKPDELKWTFDPMSIAARAWIAKNGAASIKTILATNLEDVKRVILAGTDEGLSTTQIAKNLRQFYTDRSAGKAMRVARTEVSHAAGFGQREAARQSGVAKTHSWITSRDDRVRDAHIAMDNETVDLDKAYSDGSMYPGEQDINCRCVEAFGTGR